MRFAMSHSRRALLLALAASCPGTAIALALVWTGGYSAKVEWTLSALALGAWLGFSFALREHVVRPLQTVSNMLAALREGDYSLHGRSVQSTDDLGLVVREINMLSDILREHRLGAIEASALLRQVMAEIDVAVFAFDSDEKLLLLNRAGERLLGRPARELVGERAEALGMAECLQGETPRTIEAEFATGKGRWELSRNPIRRGGLRHELVVLSSVQRALREEERQAWKRLVRVLGHEINNSLAPIHSIADSLHKQLGVDPRGGELEEDLLHGLDVIRGRADRLRRFMDSYARLARLPPPALAAMDVGDWVRRVAQLENRAEVKVLDGPQIEIPGDCDQLDQLLINLVRNAVDASLETGGEVRIGWQVHGSRVEVFVEDDGPGLEETANLFVPFFTTKQDGTGIGLVLSRQIADAHNGTLSLGNRTDGRGCIARLTLPRAAA
jgi:two-component system nitrogen regulation sensor histidine kinase NtrY